MFIPCGRDFVKTLGLFLPFMLILRIMFISEKLSLRLPGTGPDNTRYFNEILCSRVEILVIALVITLPISWKVSLQ